MHFRCDECGLKFHSDSIKNIVKLGKRCSKCNEVFKYPNRKYTKVTLNDVMHVKGKKTCKRCGAGNDIDKHMCTVCDCVEFFVVEDLN